MKIGLNTKLPSTILQLISDITAIFVSFSIQYYLRYETGNFGMPIQFNFFNFIILVTTLLFYWVILFFFSGLYKDWYIRSPFEELYTILRINMIGCFLLFFFVMSDTSKSPRALMLIYFLVSSFSICLGRFLIRQLQKNLRGRGIISIKIIIIGSYKRAVEFYEKTLSAKNWGYKSLGIILISDENLSQNSEFRIQNSEYNINNEEANNNHIPILGNINDFPRIIEEMRPQEIVISSDRQDHSQLLDIVSRCAEQNISVKIEPDLYEIFTGQARTKSMYGIPLIEVSTQLLKQWQEVIKRTFDIVFSLVVLILGLPVWILVALSIKISSRGPIFYKQPRVGKNGTVFSIIKFRSMVAGADKQNQKWTSVNDPRVTLIGKFIRKTHLDEIPQFINVLKGEMSIVGPRPEQPQYVEKFSSEISYYKRRLKVRPGITGWWQINYNTYILDTEEIKNRLKDDFYYIENISLKLDIEIIIRTVWCVLKGHGQA
jgi:exopolysaccharide biosynthesis polyprenyl glycosylphosphotransferase